MKIIKNIILLIVVFGVISSCEYETIVPDDTIIAEDVSFSNSIIPIFDNSCNTVGCHSLGHFKVDLTPDNAYQDLFSKNMINLDDPKQSKLYSTLVEPGGTHIGRSTPSQQQLILQWIEEGAIDN